MVLQNHLTANPPGFCCGNAEWGTGPKHKLDRDQVRSLGKPFLELSKIAPHANAAII